MFLALAGCVGVALLLESGGLVSWANHLELGPLRTVALPVATAIDRTLHPLHMDVFRQEALESLARIGWSDDPALLAAVSIPPAPAASAGGEPGAGASEQPLAPSPARSANPIAAVTAKAFTDAAGSRTPLAASVPRSTALPPLPPVDPARPRVVALAGDSMMAVGMSATLMRQAANDPHLRILRLFRSGTGLARPEVFNWMSEYPAMLGKEKPDVVLVSIGANDAQGFVVDGKVLAYGSEAWEKVYQQRVASYLAMIGASGARVVWMALPPMRIPVFNEKIANLNRIAYTVVSQSPQATWWNPVSLIGDEAGRYREFVTLGSGRSLRIRAADGIHLSDEGAGLFTPMLLKWLDPPPAAQPAVAVATPPPPVIAEPAPRHHRRHAHTARG
jgi:hypothetical protein